MTTIDYVFLILLTIGALSGFMKGFIKQIATIFGLIAGLFIAKALYIPLAAKLSPAITDSMTVAQVIAFIAIWLLVPLVCTLIASMLSGFLDSMSLGWVNKLLGLAMGAVLTVLIISIILNVLDFIDSGNQVISQTSKDASTLYYPIKDIIGRLFPAAHEIAKPFITT